MNEIQYEVREKDLIAFNEHQLHNTASVQKAMKHHQSVLPGIIVMIALFLFFYYKDIPTSIFVGCVALAWGFGVPFLMKWNWRKQLRKMYTEEEKACVIGHYRLRIDPKTLVEINERGESHIPWSEILRVELNRQYAFVFVSLDTALIIPRATVGKDGNLHEFVKAADEHIDKAA